MWSLLKSDLGIVFNYRSCLQEAGSSCNLRSLLMRRNLMQKSLGKVSELLMRPSLMTSDASCSGRAARHPPKTMCRHPFKCSAGRVVPVRTGNTHQARGEREMITSVENDIEEDFKLKLVFFLIQYNINVQNKHSHQNEKFTFLLTSPSAHERSQTLFFTLRETQNRS